MYASTYKQQTLNHQGYLRSFDSSNGEGFCHQKRPGGKLGSTLIFLSSFTRFAFVGRLPRLIQHAGFLEPRLPLEIEWQAVDFRNSEKSWMAVSVSFSGSDTTSATFVIKSGTSSYG